MTEQEWDSFTERQKMLGFLRDSGRASDRKLRLFACACCRRVWGLLTDARSRPAVAVVERYADGQATRDEVAAACHDCGWGPAGRLAHAALKTAWQAAHDAALAAWQATLLDRERDSGAESVAQCDLLRDVIGNPFRPVSIDAAWQTADVVVLAQAAYEERQLPEGTLDPARLVVLADALEEAGASGAILDHLRAPGPHVRGCHALDLLLSRE
jgi:hypothetical protein